MELKDLHNIQTMIAKNQIPLAIKLIENAEKIEVDVNTYDYSKKVKVTANISIEFEIAKAEASHV